MFMTKFVHCEQQLSGYTKLFSFKLQTESYLVASGKPL